MKKSNNEYVGGGNVRSVLCPRRLVPLLFIFFWTEISFLLIYWLNVEHVLPLRLMDLSLQTNNRVLYFFLASSSSSSVWETYRTPPIRRASRGDEEDPSFPNDRKDKDGREKREKKKIFQCVVYIYVALWLLFVFSRWSAMYSRALREDDWATNGPNELRWWRNALRTCIKKKTALFFRFFLSFFSPSFTDNYRWLSCNVTTRWWRPHEKKNRRRCWASNSSHVEQSKPSASQWRKGPHRMETSLGRAHYL